MNSTSVNSSKQTSNEEVKFGWKLSGGLWSPDEKEISMDKKGTSDKPFMLFELVSKTAGKNTKPKKNAKGDTVRIDENGTKYVTGKDGKTKIIRKQKEADRDNR